MKLSNNITALTISTAMKKTNRYATASSLKLSSGLKVNSAKDDPAGSAIINRLSRKISISEKNSQNYQDGVSLLQTVDGALSSINDMLQRMRELSVQSATDTLSNDDREKIQVEIAQLSDEINALSKKASFNGVNFLSGDSTRLTYAENEEVINYSYISGNVPEGMLKYDVISYGEPANTQVPVLSGNVTPATDGSITINGYTIEISETDTYDEINNKIKEACDATNIDYHDNGKLVTQEAGSNQTIEITTSPSGFLGFADTSEVGTDAVLDFSQPDYGLFALPEGTEALPSFNSGLGVEISGNNITLKGTNNQVIEMNLNVKYDEDGNPLNKITGIAPFTGVESSKILDSGQLKIQAGDNQASALSLYFRKIDTSTLRIDNLNLSTREGSNDALTQIDEALSSLLSYRSEVGAYQNRLETANSALDDAIVNMQTYRSTIEDTDVAYEMSYYSNQNVKMQAAISVLAQANQRPQQILQLLG